MEMSTDDSEMNQFISKFHSLEGISIKEKQKAFNLLLLTIPSDVDTLLKILNPLNYLEKIFKLKILLKFQKLPMLIEVLHEGEERSSFRIIQDKKFCQKLSVELEMGNFGDFVDNVIPSLSYVLRLRLFHKLGLYGTNLDGLFEKICDRYGAHTAMKIIVGCSESKIKETFEDTKPTLSLPHLKKLFSKSKSAFEKYLQQHNFEPEAILNFVAQKDINYFWQIVKTNNVPKVGKKVTRKLIKLAKFDIISNASHFKFLHLKTIVKNLGTDFDQYFLNSFPPKFDSLRRHFIVVDHNLVKVLGSRRFFGLLKKGVEEIYNRSVYDILDVATDDILEILMEEEREMWISYMKKKGRNDEDLVKYLPLKDSIPLIKKQINVTSSINHRERLLKTLIDTCKFHKDLNALKEVLLYILNRHSNDDALTDILYHLEYTFELDKLQSSHWNLIKKIANQIIARGNIVYNKENRSLKYIEFLFNEKSLSNNDILDYLKNIKNTYSWDKSPSSKQLQKLIILKHIEFMPQLLDEDDQLVFCDLNLLNRLINWNKENSNDKLELFGNSRLLNSFDAATDLAIKDEDYEPKLMQISSIIEYYLLNEGLDGEYSGKMTEKYFCFGFRYYNLNIDLYLLKNRPEVIVEHSSRFCEHLLASYHSDLEILNYIQKYSHLLLPDKIVSYCQQQIVENKPQKKIFVVLALLLPADKFLNTIDTFSSKLEKNAIYIAESFKYTTSSSVLPGLLKYCKGDFLRYSLESLYYLFYHLPETELRHFIQDLSSKAVSVRKHSIFLTCSTGSVSDVRNLLASFIDNEKNLSVQKHLFTATLKYFVKNPSDVFWETVKTCVGKLDQSDSESFDLLTNLSLIPARYQVNHITFVWTILQAKDKSKLLRKIPANLFEDLPLGFLCDVIAGQFLDENATVTENDINNFVISAIHKTNDIAKILDLIFAKLLEFVNTAASGEFVENRKRVGSIHCSFISSFVQAAATDDARQEVVKNFSHRWHSHFSAGDYFEEHLKLSLLLQFLNVEKNVEAFSAEVAQIYNRIVATHGVIVVDIFASVLQNCLNWFLNCYEIGTEFLTFCASLMKNSAKLELYFLVIELLPDSVPEDEKTRNIFYNLLKELREVTDEVVQLLLNVYINKLN